MSGIDPRTVRRTRPPDWQAQAQPARPPQVEEADAVMVQVAAPLTNEAMTPRPQGEPVRHARVATAADNEPRSIVCITCSECLTTLAVPVGVHYTCPRCGREFYFMAVA